MSDLEDAEQSVDPPRAVLQAQVERPKPSEVPVEQRHLVGAWQPSDFKASVAGIALSTVAGTVAANHQTCRENAEQLRALQVWVTETMAAAKQ